MLPFPCLFRHHVTPMSSTSTLLEVYTCRNLYQTNDYTDYFPVLKTFVILYLVLHLAVWKCRKL